MKRICDTYLYETLDIAAHLLDLADRGDAQREDVRCGILFGTVRDAAYKIRSLAEAEIARHQANKPSRAASQATHVTYDI